MSRRPRGSRRSGPGSGRASRGRNLPRRSRARRHAGGSASPVREPHGGSPGAGLARGPRAAIGPAARGAGRPGSVTGTGPVAVLVRPGIQCLARPGDLSADQSAGSSRGGAGHGGRSRGRSRRQDRGQRRSRHLRAARFRRGALAFDEHPQSGMGAHRACRCGSAGHAACPRSARGNLRAPAVERVRQNGMSSSALPPPAPGPGDSSNCGGG